MRCLQQVLSVISFVVVSYTIPCRAGVVVWVIYTQVEPFAGLSGSEVVLAIKSDPLARHDIPDWVDRVARSEIERCWAPLGTGRPIFAEVSVVLRDQYCGDEVGGTQEEVYF